MDLSEAVTPLENYDLWLVVIGLGILGATVLPRILSKQPLSMPIVLLVLGYLVIALPFGLEAPDPKEHGDIAEHLTELGVIIAIMAAGLKIDRPPSLKGWSSTWRLLGITMILTIAICAILGWWIAAFVPATAMLLGAVIAPTDPVLAAEVELGGPGEGSEDEETEEADPSGQGEEDELRFALTSEAGINDGLAFPFTNMAIAMAIAGANPGNWLGAWLLGNVLYQLSIAAIVGLGLGYLLARVLFAMPTKTQLAKVMTGLGALAATLLIYGVTEYAGGYGFIATFVGAVTMRNTNRDHPYHEAMHMLIEKSQRILTVGILIGLGGAIAGGLLDPLSWELVLCAILIIFVVRPLAGIAGLIGFNRAPWRERLAISFYGIRGIGSLYYLAYALNEETFSHADELWALVALVIVISIFVHGLTASLVTEKLDEMREERQ